MDRQISSSPSSGRSRTPALVNTAITVILVLVLTTLALQAVQSPPPAVAEFAPQVQQQIKQALANQGGQVGSGQGQGAGPGGTSGAGAGAAPPSPPPQLVPQNEVKRCVGNPPRQIEDTQSPPCIAFWNGDNGGATAPGVTKDAIYVVVWATEWQPNQARVYEAYRRFLNQRFQFYHRQLIFEYCSHGSNTNGQPADGQADAANAAAGCSTAHDSAADAFGAPTGTAPFASAGYWSNYYTYDKEMACNHHVVSVITASLADAYMRSPSNCFPYFWQYMMGNENIFAMTGQWACARLAGRPARFAAGTDGKTPPGQLNQDQRKFGAIISDIGEGAGDPTSTPETYDHLLNELKVCGVNIAKQDLVVNPTYNPSDITSALVQMKKDNVTSVFCMAVFGNCIVTQKYADNIPYYPEWLSQSYSGMDFDTEVHALPADQRVRLFGISVFPKHVQIPLEPWYQAINSVDPTYRAAGDSASAFGPHREYADLLLLASGIQMAGPRLTAQSLAQGLWRTTFPNPDTFIHEGKVGFAGQSLEMTTDAAEFFVSNTNSGPYTDDQAGQGAVCYVDQGVRHSAGQWSKGPDDVFFTNQC